MRLVQADEPLIERVLDDTFPVWHEGLSREAYSKWSRGQLRTPWGPRAPAALRAARRCGGPRGVAQALPSSGAGGRTRRLDVRHRRGVHRPRAPRRGHASRLVEQVVEQSRQEGALLAGLFSEIGTAFYERLGFSTVALDEVTVRVTRRKGAPMTLVRFGDDRDLPAIAALHAVRSADARFALRRDSPLVHYAIAKKRLFAGLSIPGTRQLEFFVAEEGVSAVAYVVLSQNQYGWTLEEAGDRDPAGARLGAMFEVLLAREPSLSDPIIRAWWPRGFPPPPQLTLSNRSDPKDVLMVRPLAGGIEVPPGPEGVFWWRSDYF
jgi:GNAT superfamily N-acetyltransferase